MKKEVTVEGKTIEAAVALGANQLGVDVSKVVYNVLEEPKKGFLGIGEVLAKVNVSYEILPEENALKFIETILDDMGINAKAELVHQPENKREYLINIVGEEAGVLIGHHGETLDALQYLTGLAAARGESRDSNSYTGISVDVENYRHKREETLCRLANRISQKVLKYHRSMTLEPMNPYERRIIHSCVQDIEGVTTYSIGADNNRRVVIAPEEKED